MFSGARFEEYILSAGALRPGKEMHMNTHTKHTANIRTLVVTAMLAAVSFVLAMLDFAVPFMPSFIKMDLSDLPALIGSFSLGPVCGAGVCLIKNLLGLFSSSTGGVGELSNFLLGCLFVVPAGLIYQKKKTRGGAILGSLVGAVCMAAGSVVTNTFIVYPVYYNFMPKEVILQAYQAILPSMKSVEQSIVCFNMPFTFLKAMLSVLITLLVYKRLSPIIKGNYK